MHPIIPKFCMAMSLILLMPLSGLAQSTLPLQLHTNDSLHQVAIPTDFQLHCTEQSPHHAVWVVDAKQHAVKMAAIPLFNSAKPTIENKHYRIQHYPLIDKGTPTDFSHLIITDNTNDNVIEWKKSSADASPSLTGVLLDLRHIDKQDVTKTLVLSAILPKNNPVSLRIELSDNLKEWQELNIPAVLLNMQNVAGEVLQHSEINLPALSIHGKFMRLSWETSINPEISIQEVTLITQIQHAVQNQPQFETIELAHPVITANNTEMAWHFNQPLAIRTLYIRTKTPNISMAYKLYLKTSTTETWQYLATHTLFNLQQNGQYVQNAPLDLPNGPWRALKIIPNQPQESFPEDLQIVMKVPVQSFAFLAQGQLPFQLSCLAQPPILSTLSTLIPYYQSGDEFQLPIASVITTKQPVIIHQADPVPVDPAKPHPPYLLWALLISAVIMLFSMIMWISKQQKK